MSTKGLFIFGLLILLSLTSCSSDVSHEGTLKLNLQGEQAKFKELENEYVVTLIIPDANYGHETRDVFLRQEVIRNLNLTLDGVDKPILILQDCSSRKCIRKFIYNEILVKTVVSENLKMVKLKRQLLKISSKEIVVLNALIDAFNKLKNRDYKYNIFELIVFLALECSEGNTNPQNWHYVESLDSMSTIYAEDVGLSKNYIHSLSSYINDSICTK